MSSDLSLSCGIQKFGWFLFRAFIVGMVGISGQAAIFTWSGGGTNANWSDDLNWSPAGTPTNGDTLVFPSPKPQLTNTNDLPNSLTYNQVCFAGAGGGYNIYGNVVTVTNSIQATNTAGTNAFNNFGINFSTADINITVSNALILATALSGSTGFSKNGAGTLTLSGFVNNGYSGATHVNDGLLELKKSTETVAIGIGTLTIGNSTGSAGTVVVRDFGNFEILAASVIVNGDGVLDLNTNIEVLGPQVTLNDGGRISDNSPGVLDLHNGSTLAALSTNQTLYSAITADVNIGSSTCTFTQTVSGVLLMYGHISGSASITQSGAGQLYFYASNSFTGPVTINGGMLAVLDSWSLGSTNSGTTVNDPGTLNIANPLNVVGEPLTLNSSNGYAGNGAVWVNSGGSNSWGGPVTLENNALIQESGLSLSLNFTGPISGPFGVTMFGGGTLVYSGINANTYAGPTVVNNGVLLLEKTNVANGAISGNVIVNSGGTLRLGIPEQIADSADVFVDAGGVFDFGTNYENINTLHGTGSITFGTNGYLEIGANGGTSTFDGVMSGTGFPGGYTVGKFGTGTFTMTGNNTYLNGSDVNGGALIIDGNQPQSPIRFMNSGTILGGSGVVGDILAGANIAPGIPSSPAVLTCSNVAFSSSGDFTVELKGPNPGTEYSQLSVRGTVNLTNATLLLNLAFTKPVSVGQQFVIITNEGSGPVLGQFNSAPDHAALCKGGYCLTIDYAGGSGGNNVVLTVLTIPPKTVTLNCVNQGWYDSTGFHNSAVSNYLCGEDAIGGTNLYRNFFVFNAPMDADSIVHAELLVNSYTNSSPHGQETYLLRSVSTPIATLEAGGSGLTNIYNDLGDGAVYAVRNVSTNESGQKAIIPLNVKFINDTTAAGASGRQIALGGSIVSLDPTNNNNQYLFAGSGASSSDVQLRLTYGTSTTLNAANTGWYDITGFHSAGNSNYIVGAGNGTFYRDFFVYDLPVISGSLVNAQLLVNSYTDSSPSGRNTYQLYDVTTPLTALTNGASGATNTYADLGSGILYGGRDVYVSESNLPVAIPLDTAFVSAAHANSGGPIALGGVISSLTPSSTNESLFGFSLGNPADAQLWLGSLINPAATPFFVNGATSNLGNGQIQFTLSGTSGTSNEIQGSFDFQNWDYIGDLTMTNTTSTFTYTNNTTVPYRFFRAELMP